MREAWKLGDTRIRELVADSFLALLNRKESETKFYRVHPHPESLSLLGTPAKAAVLQSVRRTSAFGTLGVQA